jgi:hypothetical protein
LFLYSALWSHLISFLLILINSKINSIFISEASISSKCIFSSLILLIFKNLFILFYLDFLTLVLILQTKHSMKKHFYF